MNFIQTASTAFLIAAASISTVMEPSKAAINPCDIDPVDCQDITASRGSWDTDNVPEDTTGDTDGNRIAQRQGDWNPDEAPEDTTGEGGNRIAQVLPTPPADDAKPRPGTVGPGGASRLREDITTLLSFTPPADDGAPERTQSGSSR